MLPEKAEEKCMRVKIYTVGKQRVIGEYLTRNVFESTFYHKDMPVLSQKQCSEILDSAYPNFKAASGIFVVENVDTAYVGSQHIYRNGSILNF